MAGGNSGVKPAGSGGGVVAANNVVAAMDEIDDVVCVWMNISVAWREAEQA